MKTLLARRLRREPAAYITGDKNSGRWILRSRPDVLIPRPETECLVEIALHMRAQLPGVDAAADCSISAPAAARLRSLWRANCRRRKFSPRTFRRRLCELPAATPRRHQRGGSDSFFAGDLFDALGSVAAKFDLIVAIRPISAAARLPSWRRK